MINGYSLSRCAFVRYMSARLKQDRGRERCPLALVGLSLIQRGRFISTADKHSITLTRSALFDRIQVNSLVDVYERQLKWIFLLNFDAFLLGETSCTFRVTATPTRPAASLSSPYNCCSGHRLEVRTPGFLWSNTKNLYLRALAAVVQRKARKSCGAESKW